MTCKSAAVLVIIFFALACKPTTQKGFTVSGNFIGAADKNILLAELPFNALGRIVADSTTLDSTGKFSLNTLQQPECIYQLFVEKGPGILLINDVQNIIVSADIKHPETLTVQGSPASQSIKDFDEKLYALHEKTVTDSKFADSIFALKKMPDSLKAPFIETARLSLQAQQSYLLTSIAEEKNGTALYYKLGTATQLLPPPEWEKLLTNALQKHPEHMGLLALNATKKLK